MQKKLTKSVALICALLLIITLITLTGCKTNLDDATISLPVNNVEIHLDDQPMLIAVEQSHEDLEVWFNLSNQEVISVSYAKKEDNISYYRITPLSVGTCVVNFTSVANPKMSKQLTVSVVEGISSMSFLSSTDIYLVQGSTYTLKPSVDVKIEPSDALFNEVKFSIEENDLGLTVSENGFIDATNVTQNCRLELIASYEDMQATTYVNVISGINASEDISITDQSGEKYFYLGEQVKEIELVKSTDLSNILLSIVATKYGVEDLTYSTSVNGVTVQSQVSNGEVYLQGVNVGESVVNLYIVPTVAMSYVEPTCVSLKCNVIDLPTTILLNGAMITEDELYIYDYYDEGYVGTSSIFEVYPSALDNQSGDKIRLTFNGVNAANVFRLFKMQNGTPVELDIYRDVLINSGDELYIRAHNITSLDDTSYTIRAVSVKAEEYGFDVHADVKLNLRKGIQSIVPPDEIRLKRGDSYTGYFTVYPENADTTEVQVKASSSNITVSKVDTNGYKVVANNVSDQEFIYFVKPNGVAVECKVIVYEALSFVSLEIDDVNSGKVSKKDYGVQNKLTKAYVKVGQDIKIYVSYNEGATLTDENITADTGVGISINKNARTFICMTEGVYEISVTLYGYDADGLDYEITQSVIIEAYKAITSLSINKTQEVCYTTDSVGYFNAANLSSFNLYVQVYPMDAKYANNITWKITDVFGASSNLGALSMLSGVSTTFTAMKIEGEQGNVIATATVTQFGEVFSVSCNIRITKAVMVNQIIAQNVPNENLYFDSRQGLDDLNNSFQIKQTVYPQNAFNKKVRYMVRTIDDKNFSAGDEIVSVSKDGVVVPLKAGVCKVLVCAEDSFTSSTTAQTFITIFVTVQDGKSEQTAFHISTKDELLAIGDSQETMSYYYRLTQNIDMASVSNFEPLGYRNQWAFTGYLSGKNTYNYGDDVVSKYYKIINLTLSHKATNSIYDRFDGEYRRNAVGLFYKLDSMVERYSGAPITGTVQDLTISYTKFEVDLSNFALLDDRGYYTYNIGGVAGYVAGKADYSGAEVQLNYPSILNVKVYYGAFIYIPGVHTANIGGQVGHAYNANILYNGQVQGTLVSGNDFIIAKDAQGSLDRQNSTYNLGGIVGYAQLSKLSSRFSGIANANNTVEFSTSFINSNIDVSLDFCNNYLGNIYTDAIQSVNSVVGGIVGYSFNSSVFAFSVENQIYAYNNVGGIVGKIIGGSIENCFSASKIRANENIGGIAGFVQESNIKSSYIQNYDDGISVSSVMPLLKGNNNLGGIAGYVLNSTITDVYSASYITDRDINFAESADYYLGDIYTENVVANVGGIAGYMQDCDIIRAYTNFVLYIGNYAKISMIGENSGTTLTDVYLENLYNTQVGIEFAKTPSDIQVMSSFFVEKTISNSYIFTLSNNVVNEYATIEDILASDFDQSVYLESVWSIQNGIMPYIIYGELGYGLVELAPETIYAVAEQNALSVIQNIDGIDNENQTNQILLLEFYKAQDGSQVQEFSEKNKSSIANYISIISEPQDGYVKRYIVESDNSNIVRITSDGCFDIVDYGQTKITIYSKLNAKKRITILIKVVYATQGLKLYDTASKQNGQMNFLSVYLKEEKQIFPLFEQNVSSLGVNAMIENNALLEFNFTLANGAPVDYAQYIQLVESDASKIAYNQPHSVLGKMQTPLNGLLMDIKPYILVNNKKVYLQNCLGGTFGTTSYNVQGVQLEVILGATAMEVVASADLEVHAGEMAESVIRVHTTQRDEFLTFTIFDYNNVAVATLNSTNLSNEKFNITCISNVEQTFDTLGYIDYYIGVGLIGNYREIQSTTNYKVKVSCNSNYSLSCEVNLQFIPSDINRLEKKFYTRGMKNLQNQDNSSNYNASELVGEMILPGIEGLLTIDVLPYYANYDYIEVTYSNALNLVQKVKNVTTNIYAYPFETYSQVSYLSNGIRLANVYYDQNGQRVMGKYGKYYVGVSAPLDTLIKQYTLTVSVYKYEGSNVKLVHSSNIVLACENLPVIDISYRGESSENVQEIFIPLGIEDDIDISILNSSDDPTIDVKLVGEESSNYAFASVYKVQSGYKIKIDKNAQVGDHIKIIVSATKTVGDYEQVVQNYIELIVVDYLILDLGFDYVYDNALHEVFGGSYKLSLSFEKSSFFYDGSTTIKEKIIADLAKVNAYDYNTWYAYRDSANSSDFAIGGFYENDYLQVKTRSNVSKDLYITGKFYDELYTNQKIIGAQLKYYFDKSANSWVFSKSVKPSSSRADNNAYTFVSVKKVENGRYYFEQSKFFLVDFYMHTSMENAKPIYNVQEFQDMQAGMSYILMRDLELTEFTPISNQIAYLNGNNKTVTLTSFNSEYDGSNIGIFASLAQNAVIENLQINIAQSLLLIDLTHLQSITFGLLVSSNYGNIYNCSVNYTGISSNSRSNTLITKHINGEIYTGTAEFIASIENSEDGLSGTIISSSSRGLGVQISVTDILGGGYVNSVMGILVGDNGGYITNCRINEGLTFHAYGTVGGLVGTNRGVIASSYSRAKIYSYSSLEDYSSIGGFVGTNFGDITLSYVEDLGVKSSSAEIGVNAICRVGGFVYQNTGSIDNSYSNLRITSNSATAGFVYDNIDGFIDNCYSASIVREDSKRDMAFVGVDNYNEINNDEQGIINSYFLAGNYANQDQQPATKLTLDDFKTKETFNTFAFYDSYVNAMEHNGKGVWFIPSESIGTGNYVGQNFIANMPTLVSPNLISKGYVDLLSTSIGDDGNPNYNYSALLGATLGSASHPYVIYTAEQFNKYIKEGSLSKGENSKHYVLACDLTFEGSTRMAQTYYTDFKGVIEGNGMSLQALRLSYVNAEQEGTLDTDNFGLFKQLDGATIQNLDIDIDELYASVVTSVGVLAGKVTRSNIFNINITGEAVVQGKNIVGGVIGFVNGQNQIRDITSQVRVNAVYRSNDATIGENIENAHKNNSFAGGAFGYVAGLNSKISNIQVQNGVVVLGEAVGGIVGYLGENQEIRYSSVVVDQDMALRAVYVAGGIAGVSKGLIEYCSVEYPTEIQSVLDSVSNAISSGSLSGVGALSAISNNSFYTLSLSDNYKAQKGGIIGGIVGVGIQSTISKTYAKVNIVDPKATIIGGIIGLSLANNIQLTYTSAVLDGGEMLNSTSIRIMGGIVGLESEILVNVITKDTLSAYQEGAKLVIQDSVSVAKFNYENYLSYLDEQQTNSYMLLGGLVSYVEDQSYVQVINSHYNEQVLYNNLANLSDDNHIIISAIGYKKPQGNGSENFEDFEITSKDNVLEQSQSAHGYKYIQMITDGKKKFDSSNKFYYYEPLDESKQIYGKKTEIYSAFDIESYFEFENEDSPYPQFKAVKKLSSIEDMFQTEGNIVYLQGSDLNKLAYISNSSSPNWSKYDGFRSYVFMLQTDISLNSDWQGIGSISKYFRGTFDGNGKVISGLNLNQNCSSFISYASGVTIKNVCFADVTVDIDNIGSYGIVGVGTNVTFDAVSVLISQINIDIGEQSGDVNYGSLIGKFSGSYNNINRSYVNFAKKVNIVAGENYCVGSMAGISGTNTSKISISNSYSLNTANSTKQIPLCFNAKTQDTFANTKSVSLLNVLVHTNFEGDSSVLNAGNLSGEKYYLSSSQVQDVNQDEHRYEYDKDGILSQLFNTSDYWYNSPWTDHIWQFKSGIPEHNFADSIDIILDSIGSYNASNRTYTITSSLQLENLANAINNGSLSNGGDGYRFVVANNIDGNYYSKLYNEYGDVIDVNEEEYYIYSEDSLNSIDRYIIYEGRKLTVETEDQTNNYYVNISTTNDVEKAYLNMVNKPIDSIGNGINAFRGQFEANVGVTISNIIFNAQISSNNVAYAGMFGRVKDAVISNLTLSNLTIKLNINSSGVNTAYVGGLVGAVTSSIIRGIKVNQTINVDLNNSREIETLMIGSTLGYAEIITMENVTTFKTKINGTIEANNCHSGHIIGYLICSQAFISHCSGGLNSNLGTSLSTFGTTIEGPQDNSRFSNNSAITNGF